MLIEEAEGSRRCGIRSRKSARSGMKGKSEGDMLGGCDDLLVTCIFKGITFYIPNDILSSALLEVKKSQNRKFVRYKEGAMLYSMSERKFTEIANNADAVMHVDKVALVNTEVLDRFIELNNR